MEKFLPGDLGFSKPSQGPNYTEFGRERIAMALNYLAGTGVEFPQQNILDNTRHIGHGLNNTNLVIENPQTGEPLCVLKIYHANGRCERESAAGTLLALNFGGNEYPNIVTPKEIVARPENKFRLTEFIHHTPFRYTDSEQYLPFLTDYLVGLANIKKTKANMAIVNFRADGSSKSPYGIYLRYLNRLNRVLIEAKNDGEDTVVSRLLKVHDTEARLADREAEIIASIGQGTLHRETSEQALTFNPRDVGTVNTLIQKEDGSITKIYPIDMEESGWDSKFMALALWLTHPRDYKKFTVAEKRQVIKNWADRMNLDAGDVRELNARVKLAGLFRTTTLLRGTLRGKRIGRFSDLINMDLNFREIFEEQIFKPLDEMLAKPVDELDI